MVKRAGWSNELEFGIAVKITSSPGILDLLHLQAQNSWGCVQTPIPLFSATQPISLARPREPRMDDVDGEVGNGDGAGPETSR